jgi:hypothetical protein
MHDWSSNQPPLDLTNVIKPKLNTNVVQAVPNIFTLQDCLRWAGHGISCPSINANKMSDEIRYTSRSG